MTNPVDHFKIRYADIGINQLVTEFDRDRGKQFAAEYGDDALRIVDYLVDRHDGMYDGRSNETAQTPSFFAPNSRWIVNKLYVEMQQYEHKKINNNVLMSSDFLEAWSS